MKGKPLLINFLFPAFIILLTACVPANKKDFRKLYYDEIELLNASSRKDSAYLKAHDYEGKVYVFSSKWHVDTSKHIITGHAKLFSKERNLLKEGHFSVGTDSCVLFETNIPLDDPTNALIGPKVVISIGNAIIAGICLSVPKACFGSCPTFYTSRTDNVFEARAESFSSAISPSLEYRDIDDLRHISNGCKSFSLFMKNEALETHVINHVKLLAVPLSDERNFILHTTNNEFFEVNNSYAPISVTGENAPEPSVFFHLDDQEWTSLADDKNLVSKEEMIFEFPPDPAFNEYQPGLQLTFRQTLLTTYLLYHAISYMGDEYSDILSKLELSKKRAQKISESFLHALGDIEVYSLQEPDQWKYEGKFYETGPIAKNTQVCVFNQVKKSAHGKNLKVKLVYNKGLWRFDEIRLVNLSRKINPVSLQAKNVMKNNQYCLQSNLALENNTKHVLSMPGDEFEMSFDLPCQYQSYQLFLDAQGYYLEWMRPNWLADKDLKKLHKMLANTKNWLNQETTKYKFYEEQMEKDFFDSRIYQENKSILKSLTYKEK